MTVTKLSPRQKELLEYIIESFKERHMAPTLTEMAFNLGMHRSTVNEHLQRLIKKGYLIRRYKVERGLLLANQEQLWVG